MNIRPNEFGKKLLQWFDKHGRTNLPWQQNISPYRVWVSEIMLQQTQVTTVIPYFERFMEYFPTVTALAAANIDEVLHLWTGLGYYARARHLHKTAKFIQQAYVAKGKMNFPNDIEQLQSLPGIGRSTAGAISSIAFKQPAPILDGNVKRVFTRLFAIEGWPGTPEVNTKLWKIAEEFTPQKRVADYTQAIMDLGATLCTRSQPQCHRCPFETTCLAHQQQRETAFPTSKGVKKSLPIKEVMLLILTNPQGEVLLERRPPAGIWGGLWSFPEFRVTTPSAANIAISHEASLKKARKTKPPVKKQQRHQTQSSAVDRDKITTLKDLASALEEVCQMKYGLVLKKIAKKSTFRHTFSHFHLDITPIQAIVMPNQQKKQFKIMESSDMIWYKLHQQEAIGLPAPVKSLLDQLSASRDIIT